MNEKILKKENLNDLIQELEKTYTVVKPVKKNNSVVFSSTKDQPHALNKGYTNSTESPKSIFFPQSEVLMTFKRKGPDANIFKLVQSDSTPCVVLGMRSCDAKAFTILDKVFQNDQYKDTYWFSKREKTTIIGFGCTTPQSTCFCTSVNSHPFDETGLDVLAVDIGESYYLKGITQKGNELLTSASSLDEGQEEDRARADSVIKKSESSLLSQVNLDNISGKSVLDLYEDDSLWQELSQACLNCGVCAYVCPTCHCFDIQDEVFKDEGVRMRNWDYCMLWLFTEHTSGHNPRPGKMNRLRQRFMHKFKYIPLKRDGDLGCVGCGRCIVSCPSNIDIRDIIEAMNKVMI